MGNCCKGGSSSMVWAGEDWSDSISLEEQDRKNHPSSSHMTVKIKMTKEELERLLKEVGTNGVSAEQVVARFIDGSKSYTVMDNNHHHQPWRPVLQSIPEVD